MDKSAQTILTRCLGAVQRRCGDSPRIVQLAVKIRNQANAVISAHLADGLFGTDNGEQLLIDTIGPLANSFVDVGANVGAWATAFANKCSRPAQGYLFEPSEIACRALNGRVAQLVNDPHLYLEVICAGLADAPGKMPFHIERDAGETSSFVVGHSKQEAALIDVLVTTLDDELDKRRIHQVDVVKIDAEGFDLKVLKGAMRALRRQALGVVQFEYNAPWAKAGDTLYGAIDLMSRFGYEVFLLKRNGLCRFDYEKYGEFFAYSNFVAIAPQYAATLRSIIRADATA